MKKNPKQTTENRNRVNTRDGEAGNGTVELPGKHPIIEALKAKRSCKAIVFYENISKNPRVEEIEKLAREAGIPIRKATKEHFEEKFPHINHQNVYAVVEALDPLGVEELIETCFSRGNNPFVVAVRDIQYPQNMGAIIRTAECAGADGVLIPRHRSASLDYSVSKISAGAIEHLALAETGNLAEALKKMKKAGFWVAGASMTGTKRYDEADFNSPTVLVIGGEEKGLGPLIERECDFLVSIPLLGRISSLNASVAAGLLIYEVARKRGFVPRESSKKINKAIFSPPLIGSVLLILAALALPPGYTGSEIALKAATPVRIVSRSKEVKKMNDKTSVNQHFIGEPLGIESQKELLAIARKCITAAVTGIKKPDIGKPSEELAWKRGAFVTLEINGNLRGCIGHIADDMPVAEVVAEYAVLSAMNDTRFSPVTPDELSKMEISISAMSPIVEVRSHEDFRVGIHGILIKKNGRQAIFLPQVAVEQKWDKETTLRHLCAKAWLPQDAWKEPDCRFFVYTAQVFREKDFAK